MAVRVSLRHLVEEEKPLVTPLAHDALTARLIARAGFRSIAVGGSALLAARYGLPDIGLAALGEMAAGIRFLATLLGCDRDEVAVVKNSTGAWDMVFSAVPLGPGRPPR